MDELSIFAQGEVDWSLFKAAVTKTLGGVGEDCSEEDVLRHKWMMDGFEVLAIADPRYEDDCGIPFSLYAHQLLILDTKMGSGASREVLYQDFVRRLAKTMGNHVSNKLVLIRNLQSVVA